MGTFVSYVPTADMNAPLEDSKSHQVIMALVDQEKLYASCDVYKRFKCHTVALPCVIVQGDFGAIRDLIRVRGHPRAKRSITVFAGQVGRDGV